jgi:hypothetical protein
LKRVIGQNNKYEISAFSLARDIYGLYILEENAQEEEQLRKEKNNILISMT